jgi:tetratricopeptide (TPR) repeat protein
MWSNEEIMQRNRFIIAVLLFLLSCSALAQKLSDYDALVQSGNSQLQAGSADLALSLGEMAIKMDADRWEAYEVVGKALVSLKRYEEAADRFSTAIDKAQPANQPELRDLRRKALSAESNPVETTPATTAAQSLLPSPQTTSAEASAQYPDVELKALASAFVASLNTQGMKITYDPKHRDRYKNKYQLQDTGETCKLRVVEVNTADTPEHGLYYWPGPYAYIFEGLLDFSKIDANNTQVQNNVLTINGRDFQDVTLGNMLFIDKIHQSDPFDLAMSCIAGNPVKGSECSSEPVHYRTVAFFIPDGGQTAQALGDQINRVATMCGAKK